MSVLTAGRRIHGDLLYRIDLVQEGTLAEQVYRLGSIVCNGHLEFSQRKLPWGFNVLKL